MNEKSEHEGIRQSGVIAYRVQRGLLEVALVTPRNGGKHWLVPKGHIEEGMSPEDSAAKEAFEECGVVGRVDNREVGAFRFRKRGQSYMVSLYLLAVTRTMTNWPEMLIRRREWVRVEEAAKRVGSAELRQAIERLPALLANSGAMKRRAAMRKTG